MVVAITSIGTNWDNRNATSLYAAVYYVHLLLCVCVL